MAKYQNILVAVDGSEESLHAFQEALNLADSRGLTAIAVAPPYEGDLRLVGVQHVKSLMQEPCETALNRAQQMADKAGKEVTTACVIGVPHEGIVDFAESENCDLIVMGSKGQGFWERVLLGSVTRRVIGFTKRDVLVIPPHAQLGWQKIMLATDGSENSQPAGNRSLELAQAYGADLELLSILEVPAKLSSNTDDVLKELRQSKKDLLAEIGAQAEALGIKTSCSLSQGYPARTIVAKAKDLGASLIVMGSHGRTGLSRLLMGSVTERVVGMAPCPVLVVKV